MSQFVSNFIEKGKTSLQLTPAETDELEGLIEHILSGKLVRQKNNPHWGLNLIKKYS